MDVRARRGHSVRMKILIAGGGAAGFFAAIEARRRNPAAEVLLVEKSREWLAKVSISGGGRCNVTNACSEPRLLAANYPRGARELLGPFHRFNSSHTVEWFETRGVPLKAEPDGRMFPVTDSSRTVVDCLLREAGLAGVRMDNLRGITGARFDADRRMFEVELSDRARVEADRLVICTGGNLNSADGRRPPRWATPSKLPCPRCSPSTCPIRALKACPASVSRTSKCRCRGANSRSAVRCW
jgi:predicted Rossmann fold flavoprotein